MTNTFITPTPSPYAEVRLFLFPYAGGSATTYSRLMWRLNGAILPSAVEYPGRGMRAAEPLVSTMQLLVSDLADAVGEAAAGGRFAFFGHSMGALVAFELAHRLRRLGAPQPEHLFISGAANPQCTPTKKSLTEANDEAVMAELRRLGGTPVELLDDHRLMQMVIPTLRADYTILGNYQHADDEPLDMPITVLGGRDDQVCPPATLRGWETRSTGGSRLVLLPGGHFFINEVTVKVAAAVSDALLHTNRTAVHV